MSNRLWHYTCQDHGRPGHWWVSEHPLLVLQPATVRA